MDRRPPCCGRPRGRDGWATVERSPSRSGGTGQWEMVSPMTCTYCDQQATDRATHWDDEPVCAGCFDETLVIYQDSFAGKRQALIDEIAKASWPARVVLGRRMRRLEQRLAQINVDAIRRYFRS